jgi:LysR family glycine cleavage system transcriptional activator
MSRRPLPPISSLIPFEAAARLGSMSAAARELGISQPAISRHLQMLERDVGQVLFQRNRRGLVLTSAGRGYHQAITAGLAQIAQATQQLRALSGDQIIRINANFGFTQQWLMPRFARLRAAFPKLLFRLQTSDQDDDISLAESDLAIRFGTGVWPGWHSHQLLAEEVYPICAPTYLDAHPGLRRDSLKPVDLLQENLLHMDEGKQRWLTWAEWLQLQDVTRPAERPSFVYSTYPLLLQATLAGEGISLGWGGLVDPLIAAGSLIQLLPVLRRDHRGYFITFRQGHPAEKSLRQITDWLIAEVSPKDQAGSSHDR